MQLDLDTEGFIYTKWGGEQRCKPGDWILDNGEDIYTVDGDTFARTYRSVAPGRYEKHVTVWAEQASRDGRIGTLEGSTEYVSGDYLVYNDRERLDGWAMSAESFRALYEPVPTDGDSAA